MPRLAEPQEVTHSCGWSGTVETTPYKCVCGATVQLDGQELNFLPLGDWLAAGTKAVGIKPCGGCGRRQEALNSVGRAITRALS